MLLCYRLLYSLERGCLFSFSDSLLLPNIISFQPRCKGSNDWNYFTALTLSRDGYQFNYGQLKMIQESPATGIYHHYELLTKLWSEPFHNVPFALDRQDDLHGTQIFCHLEIYVGTASYCLIIFFSSAQSEKICCSHSYSFSFLLSLSIAFSRCYPAPSSCVSNYASLEIIHYLKNVNWID